MEQSVYPLCTAGCQIRREKISQVTSGLAGSLWTDLRYPCEGTVISRVYSVGAASIQYRSTEIGARAQGLLVSYRWRKPWVSK